MRRVLSWVVFVCVVFGIYVAVRDFKSPFASISGVTASPVLKALPPAAAGCGADCRYE